MLSDAGESLSELELELFDEDSELLSSLEDSSEEEDSSSELDDSEFSESNKFFFLFLFLQFYSLSKVSKEAYELEIWFYQLASIVISLSYSIFFSRFFYFDF